jgi:hypothetical protein
VKVTCTDDAVPAPLLAGVPVPITTTTAVPLEHEHDAAAVPELGVAPTLAVHAKPDMKLVPVTVIVLPTYADVGAIEAAVGSDTTPKVAPATAADAPEFVKVTCTDDAVPAPLLAGVPVPITTTTAVPLEHDERGCCGWRRAWHERLVCESERWRERLRCQRVAQRQRCALPQVQRVARRGCGGGVVRSAAGQLERRCELRRAERERCWREQRGEQRGCERDCCWKRRLRRERRERGWPSRGQRVGRERVAQRQRACLPRWRWTRGRGPDV